MASVSIAMATCNGERFILSQLESIRAQTRMPDELVICDDCSSDSTLEIVAEFARTAPFKVLVIRNSTRLGSTRNFEKSLGLCTSEIIALSDQDDIWFPDKLERQCAILEQDLDLGGVFSDAILIDQYSRPTGKTLWGVNRFTRLAQQQLRHGRMLSDGVIKKKALGCTLVFRSALLDKIRPIPESWEHDGWIAWITAIYSRLSIIAAALIYYRLHSEQQCGVAPLSLKDFFKDKANVYTRDIRQLTDLCERIRAHGSSREYEFLPAIENMISFLRFRLVLPRGRFERIRAVRKNMTNYRNLSSGWLSALRDVVR